MQLVYLGLTVLLATFLQTSIGFGFAVFAMAIFPLIYPYGTAIALMQAIGLANTFFLTVRFHRSIRWRTMLPLLIPTLAFGLLFTFVSFSMDTRLLRIALGCVLALLSLYFFRFAATVSIQPTLSNGVAMGVVSGISNGLFGIGGPPAALYLLPAIGEKTAYLATIQAYFTLCNITNLGLRIAKGALVEGYLVDILIGWIAALVGTLCGLWAFSRVNQNALKRIVYAFIGLNGLWVVVQEIFLV